MLLREATPQALIVVAAAAGAGTLSADLVLGPREFLRGAAGAAAPLSPSSLLVFGALSVAAALFAKAFIETALRVEKLFDKAIGRPAARAAAGGLALGLLGLVVPQALGNSHPDLPRLFASQAAAPLAAGALALLLFGKLLACPLTVGSGGSGGIFIPYLMMGASLGALAWTGARAAALDPGPAAAFMTVGMGAVFAAVTLAPLTAFVLVLELTRAWGLAVPLAAAIATTFVLARAIEPHSLDTRKLLKKGLRLPERPLEWEIDAPAGEA